MPLASYPDSTLWPALNVYPGVDDFEAGAYDRMLTVVKEALPQDLANSNYGDAILTTLTTELFSITLGQKRLQEWGYVATADSDGLAVWEKMLALPPKPTNVSFQERFDRVTTKLKSRFMFYGKDFRDGVETIAGGPISTTSVNSTTGTVTITFSVALTDYQVSQIENYCEEAGPAHIQWVIISAGASNAFIAGIGEAGDTI